MSDASWGCVVDASVGIKLFIQEPFSEQAHGLFAHLTSDPPVELYVPDLFYIECANVIWKYTRRFGRPLEESLDNLTNLGRLALQVVSTASLMEDALTLAVQTGLSAYDACYACLAQQLNLPLVTADARLSKTIAWAVWLGDLKMGESR